MLAAEEIMWRLNKLDQVKSKLVSQFIFYVHFWNKFGIECFSDDVFL